jgi:hypothetical protein
MRVTHSIGIGLLFIGLASASFSGCSDPMEPASLIDELRILAIRADRPEIAPGAGTSLTALWADPMGGGRDVTFLWIAAPGLVDPAGGFPCAAPLAAPQLANAADGGDHYEIPVTPEDLIEQIAVPGETTVDVTVLALACAGGATPTIDDLERVGLLDLKSDLCRGGEGIVATKIIRVSRSESPNTNPNLGSMLLAGEEIPQEAQEAEIPSCAPRTACKGVSLGAVLTPSSFETYPTSGVMPGATGDSDEILYISWFVTAGALDDDRSVPGSPEEAASNRLSLAADDPDSLMLWVVAHDNRGGTDWRTLSLSR